MITTKPIWLNNCTCHTKGPFGLHVLPVGTEVRTTSTPPEYNKIMADLLKSGDEHVCVQFDNTPHPTRIPLRLLREKDEFD
jgi:hypothetical protein